MDKPKPMKCLKCDKLFRTTPEVRVCLECKESYKAMFDREENGKLYGNMGCWETNETNHG